MPDTFSTRYAALIAAGKIEADPGQAMLAAADAASIVAVSCSSSGRGQ